MRTKAACLVKAGARDSALLCSRLFLFPCHSFATVLVVNVVKTLPSAIASSVPNLSLSSVESKETHQGKPTLAACRDLAPSDEVRPDRLSWYVLREVRRTQMIRTRLGRWFETRSRFCRMREMRMRVMVWYVEDAEGIARSRNIWLGGVELGVGKRRLARMGQMRVSSELWIDAACGSYLSVRNRPLGR